MNQRDDVPKWHHSVSRTGVPLFWLIMGVIAGTFGAVVSAVVNPTSESLRLYATAVSAALGALGGAVAGMLSDRRKDKLAFRRKTMAATHRLVRMCLQIETIEVQATPFVEIPLDRLEAAVDSADKKQILLFGMMIKRLADLGRSPPRFEDLLETNEDIHNAMRVEELFMSMSYLSAGMPPDQPFPSYEESRRTLISNLTSGMFRRLLEHRDTLTEMRAAFERKLD
jgi:hypothetical protein